MERAACWQRAHQGCRMICGTVMRLAGSTTKMRSSRSRASGDSAPTLPATNGLSLQPLLTSCSLGARGAPAARGVSAPDGTRGEGH